MAFTHEDSTMEFYLENPRYLADDEWAWPDEDF